LTTASEDWAKVFDPEKLNSAGKCPEYGNIITICGKNLHTTQQNILHPVSKMIHYMYIRS